MPVRRKATDPETLKLKGPRTVPDKIGEAVDRLYAVRQVRLAQQREVDAIEAYEKELENHIIRELPRTAQDGALGKIARGVRTESEIYTVKDWDAFYKYLKKKNAFEMLQKRPGQAAIKERIEAGEKVPGVEPFTVVKLSLTKR